MLENLKIVSSIFGQTDTGEDVDRIVISNAQGLSVSIIAYGATLQSVRTPDKEGKFDDIALGYDSLRDYCRGTAYLGATIGRYANRITSGRFCLGGKTYQLARNDGLNHLHGGHTGFDKVLWTAEVLDSRFEAGVRCRYISAAGEGGYPGSLQVTVEYLLDEDNRLTITYQAVTDAPTPVNLTNHSYWNLAGAGNGDILGHELRLFSECYLEVDKQLIPTGNIVPVQGSPMDFQTPKTIGAHIGATPNGFDHCYELADVVREKATLAAVVWEPGSGRRMRVSTTEPGIQLYTGDHLSRMIGSHGKLYEKRGGLCLETQHFPDSPNQQQFPSTTLEPGGTYHQVTIYEFSLN